MSNYNKGWRAGDHLVICDDCGVERYRSECDFTWDGYLMCHVRNCWYPKEPIFEVPPVINDPLPIYDVRPDQVAGTETFVDATVGMWTTFGNTTKVFGSTAKKFGQWDDAPDYWS